MDELTVKQHATILQRRCAITMSTSGEESDPGTFGKKGIIRVGPVVGCGEGEYCFEISEEDVVEIRGKPRREMVWSCAVVVTEDHEVEVYEERGFDERVPKDIINCATEPLESSSHWGGDVRSLHKINKSA